MLLYFGSTSVPGGGGKIGLPTKSAHFLTRQVPYNIKQFLNYNLVKHDMEALEFPLPAKIPPSYFFWK